jgi:hypothetical protein
MSERITYEALAIIALDATPAVVEEPGMERGITLNRVSDRVVPTTAVAYEESVPEDCIKKAPEEDSDYILNIRDIKHSIRVHQRNIVELSNIYSSQQNQSIKEHKELKAIVVHLAELIKELHEENKCLRELINNHNKKVSVSDNFRRIKIKERL